MQIEWLSFVGALGLLLVPSALFHTHRVRYRSTQREWSQHWKQALSLGLHTIDFGRAMLGAWLLLIAVTRAPAAAGLSRHLPLLMHGSVLALAVLLQTLFCKEQDGLHAPFTFVTGILFGYFAPAVAGFALLFTLVIVLGVRSAPLYFPMLAGSLVAAGFLFSGKRLALDLIMGAAVIPVPWLVSLLFRRPLLVTYRSRRIDARPHTSAESQSTPGSASSAKR